MCKACAQALMTHIDCLAFGFKMSGGLIKCLNIGTKLFQSGYTYTFSPVFEASQGMIRAMPWIYGGPLSTLPIFPEPNFSFLIGRSFSKSFDINDFNDHLVAIII